MAKKIENKDKQKCTCMMNCQNDLGNLDKAKYFCMWEDDPEGMKQGAKFATDAMGVS